MILCPAGDELGDTEVVGLQAQAATAAGVGVSNSDQAFRPAGREDRGALADPLDVKAVRLMEVGHFTDRGVQLRGEGLGVVIL